MQQICFTTERLYNKLVVYVKGNSRHGTGVERLSSDSGLSRETLETIKQGTFAGCAREVV